MNSSSKRLKSSLLIAVSGAFTLAAAAAGSAPASAEEPATSFTFEYERAELESPEAARKLLKRLSLQARDACEIPGVVALYKPTAQKNCEDNVIARVVAGIDSPFLTAAFNSPLEQVKREPEAQPVRAAAYSFGG